LLANTAGSVCQSPQEDSRASSLLQRLGLHGSFSVKNDGNHLRGVRSERGRIRRQGAVGDYSMLWRSPMAWFRVLLSMNSSSPPRGTPWEMRVTWMPFSCTSSLK
jgi:hypothetical protein